MNPFPFDEYAYVKRHTRQLDKLQQLHNVLLDDAGVRALVAALADSTGLRPPTLYLYKGKRTRAARAWGAEAMQHGEYLYGRIKISLPTSAHVVVHEMAHHAMYLRPADYQPGKRGPTPHGAEFVDKLDWLTRHAFDIILASKLTMPAAASKPVATTCTTTVRRDRGVGKPAGQTRFHWEPCGRPTPCPRHSR